MNNRKNNKGGRASRLDRIERKCDRILSELASIRRRISPRHDDIDTAIDRMHRNARRMREQSIRDAQILRRVFHSKTLE